MLVLKCLGDVVLPETLAEKPASASMRDRVEGCGPQSF